MTYIPQIYKLPSIRIVKTELTTLTDCAGDSQQPETFCESLLQSVSRQLGLFRGSDNMPEKVWKTVKHIYTSSGYMRF